MTRYHGPSLAKWLLEQKEAERLTPQRRRTVRAWLQGNDPLETYVDATLCSIDLHLRDVPAWAVFGLPPVAVQGLEVAWNHKGEAFLTRAE